MFFCVIIEIKILTLPLLCTVEEIVGEATKYHLNTKIKT